MKTGNNGTQIQDNSITRDQEIVKSFDKRLQAIDKDLDDVIVIQSDLQKEISKKIKQAKIALAIAIPLAIIWVIVATYLIIQILK